MSQPTLTGGGSVVRQRDAFVQDTTNAGREDRRFMKPATLMARTLGAVTDRCEAIPLEELHPE
jgi:hypothetical protein